MLEKYQVPQGKALNKLLSITACTSNEKSWGWNRLHLFWFRVLGILLMQEAQDISNSWALPRESDVAFSHVNRTLLVSFFWITEKLLWQDRHCPWDKTLPEINALISNHSGDFSTVNTAQDQSMTPIVCLRWQNFPEWKWEGKKESLLSHGWLTINGQI